MSNTPSSAKPLPFVVSVPRSSRGRIIKVKDPYSPTKASPFLTAAVQSPVAKLPAKKGLPPPSRAILELSSLQETLTAAMCRKCKGNLEFACESIGLASTPTLKCGRCGNTATGTSKVTSVSSEKKKRVQLSDSPVNVLTVLAYLSVGDGGTECQRLCGLLDLPHSRSVEKSYFSRIEQDISPTIIELSEEVMRDNLISEVKASLDNHENFDVEAWQNAWENHVEEYPLPLFAKIRGSTDMGWQERGFDSLSGHALFFGTEERKPLYLKLKQKHCKICSLAEDGAPVRDHDCGANHTGSSASMEPLAVVDMLHDLHDKYKCHLTHIITDDDSKMKANCRWSHKDYESQHGYRPHVVCAAGKRKYLSDLGKLKLPIPEPQWMSDPNHRGKTVRNRLKTQLKLLVKERLGMAEIDVLRIATNFNYMMRQLWMLTEDQYEDAGEACVLHHFDIHCKCPDFCKRKDETEEEKKSSGKFYRCKTANKDLFERIMSIVKPYVTKERLAEVAHGYDTNANESMNNMITWMAPKNKCFSDTASLRTRIALAICIKSIGYSKTISIILDRLGIDISEGTRYWLEQAEDRREGKKAHLKLLSTKRKRRKGFYDKLREKTTQARKDVAAGTGYATGSGALADLEGAPPNKKPKLSTSSCRCGSRSHLRTNHRNCPLNAVYKNAPKAIVKELEQDSDNQEFLDNLSPEDDHVAGEILALTEKDELISKRDATTQEFEFGTL